MQDNKTAKTRQLLDKTSGTMKGFTVVELAIVMVIIGLIIAAALPSLRTYKNTNDFYETQENMQAAHDALREYFGLQGRYPCPADPTLSIDDPNFGLEPADCKLVEADPCPTGVVCTNTGTRDADNDGNPDAIMIGVLPSRTLAEAMRFAPFEVAEGKDAYLGQITYAVTEAMALRSNTIIRPANIQLGAITVRDEFSRDIIDPPQSAHYVIVSHGYNSRGAYNLEGNQVGDCDVNTIAAGLPSPPPPGDIDVAGTPGIELELENCDNDDGRFISGLQSLVDGDNYFDDHVVFNARTATSLWRQSSTNPNFLYNTNFGNVGIGTNTPLDKLDVNGNLRAETSITADGGYCDTADPTECLDPDAIGGTAMTQCPAGQVATGIEGNDLVCVPLFAAGVSFNCPAGTFVTAFTNLGNVTCAAPP
ncbi:MAG: type II secretion system protein [Alphaproteobacteria bacterium]|nr:type II secretion system protein [Alphaproteobacteria bacterium]